MCNDHLRHAAKIQGQTRQHSNLITLFILFRCMSWNGRDGCHHALGGEGSMQACMPVAVPQDVVAMVAEAAATTASALGATPWQVGQSVRNAVTNFNPLGVPTWPQQVPVAQSLSQSLSHSVGHSVNQSVTQSVLSHSVSQVTLSISQSLWQFRF